MCKELEHVHLTGLRNDTREDVENLRANEDMICSDFETSSIQALWILFITVTSSEWSSIFLIN
jgi:hypothetical protein